MKRDQIDSLSPPSGKTTLQMPSFIRVNTINLKIKGFHCGKLYNEISDEDYDDYEEEYNDLSDIPPLESDEEEVREGKGLKILTPNKLLTRLTILLAQINAGNNLNKLKNEFRQILSLFQHNNIPKKAYNNLIKSL